MFFFSYLQNTFQNNSGIHQCWLGHHFHDTKTRYWSECVCRWCKVMFGEWKRLADKGKQAKQTITGSCTQSKHRGGFGKSGHRLTANLFDGPVPHQEYIMLSARWTQMLSATSRKATRTLRRKRLTTPTPSVRRRWLDSRLVKSAAANAAHKKNAAEIQICYQHDDTVWVGLTVCGRLLPRATAAGLMKCAVEMWEKRIGWNA